MALSCITQLGQSEHMQCGACAGRLHHGQCFVMHGLQTVLDPLGVHLQQDRQIAAHDFKGHGGTQKTNGRTHACTCGHHHPRDTQLLSQSTCMQRRRATKRHHGEVLQVLTAFYGVNTGRIGHVFFNHLAHARCRPKSVHAQSLADVGAQGLPGQGAIKRHAACSKAIGVDATQHQVGVCHGRLFAATPIASRPGLGAAGVWPDGDALHGIDSADGAAPRANFHQLDDGNAHGQSAAFEVFPDPADFEAARPFRLAIVDQANLGGGAAHVEGQDLVQAAFACQMCGQNGTASRAGFDQPNWKACGQLQRGQSPARHHQQQWAQQAFLADAFLQPKEVAAHQRAYVGVGDGGRKTLVFSNFGAHLRRQTNADLWPKDGGQDVACALFMCRVGPSVHEANGHRFDVGITHLSASGPDVFFMEVQQHRAIGRDAFTNSQAPRPWHQFGGALQVDVVGIKAFFVAHGQDIPKALGGDQGGARALAFDQCVGGQCGAVDEDLNAAAVQA